MGTEKPSPPANPAPNRSRPQPSSVRFVVDVMLGTLARWLRILGYDTLYDNRLTDDEILELSRSESRVVLTRDRRLAARKGLAACVLIEEDRLHEQLRIVLTATDATVPRQPRLIRCLVCNTILNEVEKEVLRDRVPPYVYRTQSRFRECPRCRKLYWRGTHRERMAERLKDLIREEASPKEASQGETLN